MSIERASSRISRRGEQTREQIIVAARQLFTEHGYHKTSVYDLFEQASITKGAFFHHWKTKEDLALAILEHVKENFEIHFFSVAKAEGRARDKIERLLRNMGELCRDPKWGYGRIFALWCAEMGTDEEKIGPAVHALKMRWCTLWQELIQRAQQEHDLRADISAENLGFLVISAIFGVQLMSRGTSPDTAKTALETLRRTILT